MNQEVGNQDLMDKLISLCKQRGIIFPGSEIYGGLANSWDFGPYGALLKNNIRQAWIKHFVTSRDDMVLLESGIIMNPKVWQASGHLQNFTDPLVDCKKCKKRFRADHILEQRSLKPGYDKESPLDWSEIHCPECGGDLTEVRLFNLMFKSHMGPVEDAGAEVYLRPELAAGMFTDFKLIQQSKRLKLPFGIAQVGKAFRNEITPGNFIFRTREFEIMELEYFVKPSDWEKAFANWLDLMKSWLKSLGVAAKDINLNEIPEGERAHYSKRTVDFEYNYPFGLKELYGLAYRTDFDLASHAKFSGADLTYTDPETGEKFVPHVVEPSMGLERTVLVTLLAAYHEEDAPTAEEGETDKRVVLKLPKHIAPIKVAILPLSKKEELAKVALPIAQELRQYLVVEYDDTQSIGRRYRRQDEIGTPYCVTVDFDSLQDKSVTVRDRDTMKQERIKIAELIEYLRAKFV
ncbi:MAG: Glycine-tRNA ligase [Parcubacteria group bacterium GW2011_GWE2_43_12]|nr:MAG: Glycine-tRNA ligase [Parcubacteria group bacterium GW2011_GWE2_43_12]